jgi:hypothetical protein
MSYWKRSVPILTVRTCESNCTTPFATSPPPPPPFSLPIPKQLEDTAQTIARVFERDCSSEVDVMLQTIMFKSAPIRRKAGDSASERKI